ncbi:MAG: HNH endonuclease [Bdellovibrionales bacterium]
MPISKDLFTIIDDEDFERLRADGLLKWNAQKAGRRFYVSKNTSRNGKLYLHRYIMNAEPGFCIDHINGDSLDNRKENLRVCSYRENARNKKKDAGFKGVTKAGNMYSAQIQHQSTHINLGTFSSPSDAARAYDLAAAFLFGEFAVFNFEFSKKFLLLRNLQE